MAKSKRSRAVEFSQKQRSMIYGRDGGRCIFCNIEYHIEGAYGLDLKTMSIMHYIPRSRGGLGIEQNGAIGCYYHHHMMDNGKDGRRQEMLRIFRAYLRNCYPNWSENELYFRKGN